jgi:Family of unknown function (DUF6502)
MQSVKDNLLAALRYLLKPMVRLAVKTSVSFPEFSEVLKQAYVDVARKQLKSAGKDPSNEGISLISGAAVSDVDAILRLGDDAKFGVSVQAPHPLPTLLGAWHSDNRYAGPYGVLRDLPFDKSRGDEGYTFSDLATEFCPGLSPKVMLDELVRTGAVQEIGDHYYRAVDRSYIPAPLSVDSLLGFARVVHNICETLEVNMRPESSNAKGLIERSIYTVNGMTKRDLKDFDEYIRKRGQVFTEDIDNWLSSRDVYEGEDRVNTGVGFYHYVVNDDDERALSRELPT